MIRRALPLAFPLSACLPPAEPVEVDGDANVDGDVSVDADVRLDAGDDADAEVDDDVDDDGPPPSRPPDPSPSSRPDPDRTPGSDHPPPPPAPRFTDVTAAAGLEVPPGGIGIAPFCVLDDVTKPDETGDLCWPERFLGAAAVADFDDDGWPDVYVSRRDAPGRLLHNEGDGTFVDLAAQAGLTLAVATGAAAWLDIDEDGDLDLLTTAVGMPRHFLWVNDGNGHFAEAAIARGVALASEHPLIGMGIGVGDYDRDGWLDLFVAEWHPTKETGVRVDRNRLLRNRGAAAPGYFEDRTHDLGMDLAAIAPLVDAKPGVYGFAPAFVDLDADGWPELALTADFGTSRLLWNDGAGRFVDGTWAAGVGTERNGMGSAFGDFDGDGDLDWFVSAIWTSDFPTLGHRLYRNDGARSFVDVSDVHGVREHGWGWGATWLDFDLDGDLDLAMAAGWPGLGYDEDRFRLWENTGEGEWPERSAALGIDLVGDGRGVVTLDYDRDGDEDLLVVGNEAPPRLFRNDIADGGWLVVRAEGSVSNRQSIGAEVTVEPTPGAAVQVRQLGVGSHLMGQPEVAARFGLGSGETPVHRVTVHWPASGVTREWIDVPRDTVLVADEDG